MKAVIDTNVLVSALLREGTPPAEVLDDLLQGKLTALFNERILGEYREVLVRPKFGFDPLKVDAVLRFIISSGELVLNAAFAGRLPDPDDQPFADVAFTGKADVLKERMRRLRDLGEDENTALELDDRFTIIVACKRCRKVRIDESIGMTPRAQPQRETFSCGELESTQPDGRCGGEIWSYDESDLGRRNAAALGIPTPDSW